MYCSFRRLLVLAVLFAFVRCVPCDCLEATLIDPRIPGTSLKITFDESLFGKDKFTITYISGGSVTLVHGTFENTDDEKIRFDLREEAPFLSLRSGEVNGLSCDEARGQFTITPPVPPGTPPLTLTFQCTKKK